VIRKLDIYMGSVHLSSIDDYNVIANAMFDVTTSANDSDAHYQCTYGRNVIVGANGTITVCFPLMAPIFSLAQRYLPIGVLRDDIRVDITLADSAQWGQYAAFPISDPVVAPNTIANVSIFDVKLQCAMVELASHVATGLDASLSGRYAMPTFDIRSYSSVVPANTGAINHLIPCRVSSATAVFVLIRPTANVGNSLVDQSLGLRTAGTMQQWSFRLGAHTVPQIPVKVGGLDLYCSEARVELARALQRIGHQAQPSVLGATAYAGDGFVLGLALDAFQNAGEVMSDGTNTLNSQLYFEARLASTHAALTVTYAIMYDKVLILEQGLLLAAE
jgi:hypothetical protein